MRLLYCIALDPENRLPAEVSARMGAAGEPLECVPSAGLVGVISAVPVEKPSTDQASLLAYQQVIDAVFAHAPLLPMRFGTQVSDAQQLAAHLAEQAGSYQKLLAELDGCVEMGLRQFYPKAPDTEGDPAAKPLPVVEKASSLGSGRGFLAARKAHFASREQGDPAGRAAAAALQTALQGLYVRCKVEFQSESFAELLAERPGEGLLSIHFLVHRSWLPQFQAVAEKLRERHAGGLLLSGPWPPYTFAVTPDQGAGVAFKPGEGASRES